MHLQANVARFERPSVASPRDHTNVVRDPRPLQSKSSGLASFVSVLQGNGRPSPYISPLPAMVLDDACLVERDVENFVMGELMSFSSILNIHVLLQNKGFQIDIEGVPLHAWSRATFTKIYSRWGEVMEFEENKVDFFACKRICIKTKMEDNILEKFKVVLRGKVFVIRAKELFVWSLVFKEVDDEGCCSDVESSKEGESLKGEPRQFGMQDNDRDEEEVVFETCFGDKTDKVVGDTDIEQPVCESKHSSDPFDIYGLLRKQGANNIDKRVDNDQPQGVDSAAKIVENEHELSGNVADSSIPFPPGFTPPNPKDALLSRKYLIVGLLGQAMGFFMVGCEMDIEGIIGRHEEEEETKASTVSNMDVKMFWGNSCFKYTFSEALGLSGSIISVWDPSVFHFENHIVSDNFIALYGLWKPSKTKLLVISVYAPQALSEKMTLWNFLSLLISRWDGANAFNDFILNSNLLNVRLDGYSFTWSHRSASKMSKLDRFLISDGFHSSFPHMSGICLDRHLSDHRPILFRDVCIDYEATPFRFNGMVRFKKKLQHLKKIRLWVMERKKQNMGYIYDIKSKLHELDVSIDHGGANADILASRLNLMKNLHDIKVSEDCDYRQKAKIRWAVEGDENSKFFHGIINKKRSNLSIRGILVDGEWVSDPIRVKEEFRLHFAKRLRIWSARFLVTKFIRRFGVVEKISLQVVTKILALRLLAIISSLISDVQTAFVPGRQILDGPFIINELLAWCKHYKHQAMVFKVDFAKAYDFVRWDYLMDVLKSFGFRDKWCSWIKGSLLASMASVLVNGSPTAEFQFFRGLKQGDPLAPYLFIFVMDSLHLSFSRTVDVGIFKGIQIGKDITLSHLFYADDAVFIGEWSDENLSRILHVLHCFTLASGLKINVPKSVLSSMEAIRRNFFYGSPEADKNITWVKWSKVLAAKQFGGLGVSSLFSLNRALLMRWVRSGTSLWRTITSEVNGLKAQGVDILSHCLKRVGNGLSTKFWFDPWIVNVKLCNEFPRLFALELNKSISVAEKLQQSVDTSFRRPVRGGSESAQLESLSELIEGVILSNSRDRWFWDMNGSGSYRVKDVRNMLDDFFSPKMKWLRVGFLIFRLCSMCLLGDYILIVCRLNQI
nr:RNA-directed DNA polymerase, eukaryota [Tanacetum cinerariifolium]